MTNILSIKDNYTFFKAFLQTRFVMNKPLHDGAPVLIDLDQNNIKTLLCKYEYLMTEYFQLHFK